MCEDTIDIEERIKKEREERQSRDLKKHDMRNRELLGQCPITLRVYLMGLSRQALAMAREAEYRVECDEMYREERMMRKEQYPCDDDGEMYYGKEFKFEWL